MSPRDFIKPDSLPAWFGALFSALVVICGAVTGYANLQANDRMYAQQISEMKAQNDKALAALETESRRRSDKADTVLDRLASQIYDNGNRLTKLEALVTIPYRK